MKGCQDTIFHGLEKEFQGKVVNNSTSNGFSDLPSLAIDGIPTSLDEMNQVRI